MPMVLADPVTAAWAPSPTRAATTSRAENVGDVVGIPPLVEHGHEDHTAYILATLAHLALRSPTTTVPLSSLRADRLPLCTCRHSFSFSTTTEGSRF